MLIYQFYIASRQFDHLINQFICNYRRSCETTLSCLLRLP